MAKRNTISWNVDNFNINIMITDAFKEDDANIMIILVKNISAIVKSDAFDRKLILDDILEEKTYFRSYEIRYFKYNITINKTSVRFGLAGNGNIHCINVVHSNMYVFYDVCDANNIKILDSIEYDPEGKSEIITASLNIKTSYQHVNYGYNPSTRYNIESSYGKHKGYSVYKGDNYQQEDYF